MTTIAAFSDVHGNTPALRIVLAAMAGIGPDIIVNLRDIASGGVDPRGTLDLLRSRTDIVTVRGNHERQLCTLARASMSRSDQLAYDVLTDDDRAWLDALPARCEPTRGVLAFHGSPSDDLCYLLETVDGEAPNALREATDAEVVARLGEDAGRYRLHLCGHTHLQRTRTLPDGTLVVNPGSAGWPAYEDDRPAPHAVEAGTPHARFSVVTWDEGAWTVAEHAIAYDVDEAVTLAERNQRPDVAHALRTGLVRRR
jgi:predicted phosphodiesterase